MAGRHKVEARGQRIHDADIRRRCGAGVRDFEVVFDFALQKAHLRSGLAEAQGRFQYQDSAFGSHLQPALRGHDNLVDLSAGLRCQSLH